MKFKRHKIRVREFIAFILSLMIFKINYSKDEILTQKENILVTIILLIGILICWTYPNIKRYIKKLKSSKLAR